MIYQDVPEQPYVPNAPLPIPQAFLTGGSTREFHKRVNRESFLGRYAFEQVVRSNRFLTEVSFRILLFLLGGITPPSKSWSGALNPDPWVMMLRWTDEPWWKHTGTLRPELSITAQINQQKQDWRDTRNKYSLKYDCEFKAVRLSEANRILDEQRPRQGAQWESERAAAQLDWAA